MGRRAKKRFSGKPIPSSNIANTPFMVWWSQAGRQATNNLSLAQITVEPLGVLLAANPSPRCSAPFRPLDAPLIAVHLYGIESPGHSWPASPGYSILYWPPSSTPYWQIRGVRCLPVCSVPTIGFRFAGTCFSAIPLKCPIDQNETWAQGLSACDLFFVIYSYNKKSQFQGLAIGS